MADITQGTIMASKPLIFLSYARRDDEHHEVSMFRGALEHELQLLSGKPLSICQDRDLRVGDVWLDRIDQLLSEVEYFMPILTPSYFESNECARELQTFVNFERGSGRHDRILPIYFIEAQVLEDSNRCRANTSASLISQRQRWDWRPHFSSSTDEPSIRRAIRNSDLAQQIHSRIEYRDLEKPIIAGRLAKKDGSALTLDLEEYFYVIPKTVYMRLHHNATSSDRIELDVDLFLVDADTEQGDVDTESNGNSAIEDSSLADLWHVLRDVVAFSVGVTGGSLELRLNNLLSMPDRRGFVRGPYGGHRDNVGYKVYPSGDLDNPTWTFRQSGEEDSWRPLNEAICGFLAELEVTSVPCEVRARFYAAPSQIVVTKFAPKEQLNFSDAQIEALRLAFSKRIRREARRLAATQLLWKGARQHEVCY